MQQAGFRLSAGVLGHAKCRQARASFVRVCLEFSCWERESACKYRTEHRRTECAYRITYGAGVKRETNDYVFSAARRRDVSQANIRRRRRKPAAPAPSIDRTRLSRVPLERKRGKRGDSRLRRIELNDFYLGIILNGPVHRPVLHIYSYTAFRMAI